MVILFFAVLAWFGWTFLCCACGYVKGWEAGKLKAQEEAKQLEVYNTVKKHQEQERSWIGGSR